MGCQEDIAVRPGPSRASRGPWAGRAAVVVALVGFAGVLLAAVLAPGGPEAWQQTTEVLDGPDPPYWVGMFAFGVLTAGALVAAFKVATYGYVPEVDDLDDEGWRRVQRLAAGRVAEIEAKERAEQLRSRRFGEALRRLEDLRDDFHNDPARQEARALLESPTVADPRREVREALEAPEALSRGERIAAETIDRRVREVERALEEAEATATARAASGGTA